ncbi:MAG: TonB-dependent receptor [Chitinophagaceae bacterium]|nr:TonB-dependent receptor [Chitinophagaceae bacterium]
MKTIIISSLFFFAGWFTITTVQAQVRISGTVKDHRGDPIIGASISIKDSYDGAVTDSTGHYHFGTRDTGSKILSITNIGYKSFEQAIQIAKQPITIDAVLKEQVDELRAVTVTAGAFEASDRKRAATVLSSLDVLTTGGANADITATVKTLPGAQQVGEQEGLFVRGGAGYETKQFIDGTVVNNPYYSSIPDIAQRGRFSPQLFKGTIFTTGGYSALYGQALSSALILESIDMPDRSEATFGISTVFTGGGLQKLAKDKKSSWGVNYGYTNVWPYFQLLKTRIDYFHMPEFHTGEANFRFKTKNGGIVKFYTSLQVNHLGLRREDIDSTILKDAFELRNHNWYNNVSWRENLGNGWKMNLGTSYSTNYDIIHLQVQDQQNKPQTFNTNQPWMTGKIFDLHLRQDLSQVKAVFEKKLAGISSIRFGSEYWYSYYHSLYNQYQNTLKDNFNAVFAESDIYLTNALALKLGGRLEHSSIINKWNVAPRLSMAYKTGKGSQVSMAYGTFYQKPENTQLLYTTNLGYTKATHYIANYQKMANDKIFRVELFYKQYQDLVKTSPTYNNNGSGYAKGIEFFWRDKKTIKNLDYWISYSYLDTKRDYLNYPNQLQPNFAAKHTASLVTKRYFTKINTGFNFTYSFATGRPYYNMMQSNGKYIIAEEGKTKAYNNLGFSANYLTSFGKAYGVLVASVTNVLGQNQVYGYNYSHNGMNKVPVIPTVNRFYFIGLFLSWGVDRRQDAINNNL